MIDDSYSIGPVSSDSVNVPDDLPEAVPETLIDDEAIALGEKLRAIVEYVFPRKAVQSVSWKMVQTTLAIPNGSTWRHVAIAPLEGKATMVRRTAVEVITPRGRIVRLYAAGRQHGNRLRIHQLRPSCRTIDAVGIVRRMAVIESILHPERPDEGRALAELLDVSEPAVHYRRKAMADWIRDRTGGKGGLPGLLNRDQSNKGRAREGRGMVECRGCGHQTMNVERAVCSLCLSLPEWREDVDSTNYNK
jgi:hypothetical protein